MLVVAKSGYINASLIRHLNNHLLRMSLNFTVIYFYFNICHGFSLYETVYTLTLSPRYAPGEGMVMSLSPYNAYVVRDTRTHPENTLKIHQPAKRRLPQMHKSCGLQYFLLRALGCRCLLHSLRHAQYGAPYDITNLCPHDTAYIVHRILPYKISTTVPAPSPCIPFHPLQSQHQNPTQNRLFV